MKSSSEDPLRHLAPTGELTLSPGNEQGQDEDPSILRAADGRLYAAWYSNRNGLQPDGLEDKEIFLARSSDGRTWTDPPIQVTRHTSWAFAPSLTQDDAGGFHLAWWRWTLTPAGCAPASCGIDYRIMYKSSANGVDWNLDEETTLADGPGDWLPSIVFDGIGRRLLAYFASPVRNADPADRTLRLYVRVKDGSGWGAIQRLNGVNPDGFHETYPYVSQREDGQFLMTWTRYDGSASWLDPLQVTHEPSTETMFSTSSDGLDWTAPIAVSSDPTAIDVFPSLYADQAGTWHVLWLTTTTVATGATVERSMDGGPTDPVSRPEIAGYTGRVVATATPDIYWGTWVSGADPYQKVRYALFSR